MNADDPTTSQSEVLPLVCRRFKNPTIAFGAAVDLLRSHKPFSQAAFGNYASVLRGQIAREHYVFAVQNKLVVGYVGWALCNEEVSRAWTERRHAPKYAECLSGDCWVGLTYFATSRHATFALMGHIKRRYPGYKIYGLRRYQDGRERFLHTGPRPAGTRPTGD
jgi:hemolysin-activating ACP:hemolysin acyltransferase